MHHRLQLFVLALALAVLLAGCTTRDATREQLEPDPALSGLPLNATTLAPSISWYNDTFAPYVTTPNYRVSGTDIGHLEPEASGNVTGYVVEVAWSAAGPHETDMALWVRGHDRPPTTGTLADSMLDPEPLVKVEGPSPLVVVLPRADLSDESGYSVFVRSAGPVGANPGRTAFVSAITTFDGLTFDPEWRSIH